MPMATAWTWRPSRETRRDAKLCELAFGEAGEEVEQMVGEDELEDGVAEKFEALVVEMVHLRFVAKAGMGQRFGEQERIAELVFDPLFERSHGRWRLTELLFEAQGASELKPC